MGGGSRYCERVNHCSLLTMIDDSEQGLRRSSKPDLKIAGRNKSDGFQQQLSLNHAHWFGIFLKY